MVDAGGLALALWAAPRLRLVGTVGMAGAALALTLYLLDVFLPRIAPRWSQKGPVAAYFQERRSGAERLVAYCLFWRGETFYTKNAIYEGRAEERTVFDGDDRAEVDRRLRAWVERHAGERHYFLYLPGQEPHLRALLSAKGQATFTVLPQPNDKFALARADL